MLRKGFGLKLNSGQYREIAYQAILRLLDQEHAVLDREIEAKLADRPVTSTSPRVTLRGLDPHHLSNALDKLIEDKRIEVVRETTRGGSTIPVYALTDRRALRRETRFVHAAARKRLLQARYLSWTRDSDEVRTELGYNLIQTTGPLDRLTQFFGVELPKYALYNARRWQEVARILNSMANTLRLLRDPSSPWKVREQHMDILRQAAATELGAEREWVGRIRDSDDTQEGAL